MPPALVPVRISSVAKRRLAHVLGAGERIELVRRLFDHVVSVLREAGLRVIALSPTDIDVADGVDLWRDRAAGLNAAIGAALEDLGSPVLVVHADLAALTPDDIHRLLANDADVVVARAHDGGTNGLLMRKPIRPAFGAGSALVHALSARAAGLRASVVDLPGFSWDVDDEATLARARGDGWRDGVTTSAYASSDARRRP